MKILITLSLIFSAVSFADLTESPQSLKPNQVGIGEWIPDLNFIDIQGKAGKLSDFQNNATVIFLNQIECPLSKKYIPTIQKFEKEYASKINFLIVNADSTANKNDLLNAYAKWGLSARYLPDFDSQIGSTLGAKSTTEVFVLDRARTLVYRGPIDDQYGINYALPAPRKNMLKNAIDAVLAGAQVKESAFTAPGCALSFAAVKPLPATYHNRISRILQQNCESCHRTGETGPFTLDTYKQAKSHGPMIRKVTQNKLMPPWFANPKVGEWANDRSLSTRDINAISQWVGAGMPEGNPKDAPVPVQWTSGWNIGTPDVVYSIEKPIQVPATGVVPYQYQVVSVSIPGDKWIQATEIRVNHPEVVHHVIVYQNKGIGTGEGFLAGRVPGESWRIYPEGMAKRLFKGNDLVFEIHYTPNGTAVEDQPKLGIIFAKNPPTHEIYSVDIGNRTFTIPAHADNFPVSGDYTTTKKIKILSFLPHMHLRGKAFQYEATLPGGKKQMLLDVPKYDFNWQLVYIAKEPIELPIGTKIQATGWYDNSEKNPANPDPTKDVHFGLQTFEEMMLGYFDCYDS